jgi:23S rRNA (cytidine1920-2'-O)/16S rRNA (cytidine1409-2'-O)-methyltransferase
VSDVSFISLKLVLPASVAFLKPNAKLAVLVKPQFEAGRDYVKKGIVRDEAVHRAVCEDISAFITSLGFTVDGIVPSPIEGGDGNREFLLGAHRG